MIKLLLIALLESFKIWTSYSTKLIKIISIKNNYIKINNIYLIKTY